MVKVRTRIATGLIFGLLSAGSAFAFADPDQAAAGQTPPQVAPVPQLDSQEKPASPVNAGQTPAQTPVPQLPAETPAQQAPAPGQTAGTTTAPGQTAPQAPAPQQTIGNTPVAQPTSAAAMPPPGSAPVVRFVEIRSTKQNGALAVDPETYLYYIQTKPSSAQFGRWVPYNEQTVIEDFRRLWNTNFLDDLVVSVEDVPYPNGIIGKHVIFDLEERQRVKIVDYVGSKKVEQSKIEDKLRDENLQIRLDSFIDPGLVQRVKNVVQQMYAEKGYLYATVSPEIKPVAGGPKLVHLTFNIDEGPKVKIGTIDFVGNKAISDGKLAGKMKENKAKGFFSFITGGGTYKQDKFEEDADKVSEYYRENGYIAVRIGQPDLKVIEDSPDRKTRWIQLQIPVTEGQRYRVGDFKFEGQKVVREEALKPLFKLKQGDWYNEKLIRKGLDKARELFGSAGYWEFVGYPDLKPRGEKTEDEADGAGAAGPAPPAPAVEGKPTTIKGAPVVDVTMRMQPGKQYFVDRITFVGNTTTRDNVIRREVRLYEGGVFNTEALKFSVKRLNQLGYFKNLEGDAIKVDKTPGADNKVDVTLKFEEQNRNQLTFGAGVSQYEGFFGQLAFQTSNFMGRGETFSVSLQAGYRAKNYQVGFTEPFLFDRPLTLGTDVYVREIQYIGAYTQRAAGGNIVFGFPLHDFTRMFVNYNYEKTRILELDPAFRNSALVNNPFWADALLLGQNGERTISKITPSVVHNTVDNPIFPSAGRRYTASIDLAGIGGNTSFISPKLEGGWYLPESKRMSLGLRGAVEYIRPYGDTLVLPIIERLFLGGEYSVRGFDIRSIGPRDPVTGVVLGGTKSLLFNVEQSIGIAGPVRLILFYDAGQVQDQGHGFAMQDFRTSTGAEIRFFMPVLNVPFRLIFAANPRREGVLTNSYQPAPKFTFRFAVGTTF
jgi:outer membrane protein insertion porin family